MPIKDLHSKPFDSATITKLDLLESYFEKWLNIFSTINIKQISIFDLFAGSGLDMNKISGSPLRILEVIKRSINNFENKDIQIKIFFNEFDKNKFENLKNNCEDFIISNNLQKNIIINYYNEDFFENFSKIIHFFDDNPKLFFLDQNGYKFITSSILETLLSYNKTDVLFFISTTHLRRFIDEKSTKDNFDLINLNDLKKIPNELVHKELSKLIKLNLKEIQSEIYTIPFSIKKDDNRNIHGLIFISKHILAADRFLHSCWEVSKQFGEANFDINKDYLEGQLDLISGKPFLSKVNLFQAEVENLVLKSILQNNIDVYLFTINSGMKTSHSNDTIKKLKIEGKISFKGSPCISYNHLKNNKLVNFELTDNISMF